jgi:hypothetical protein
VISHFDESDSSTISSTFGWSAAKSGITSPKYRNAFPKTSFGSSRGAAP